MSAQTAEHLVCSTCTISLHPGNKDLNRRSVESGFAADHGEHPSTIGHFELLALLSTLVMNTTLVGV